MAAPNPTLEALLQSLPILHDISVEILPAEHNELAIFAESHNALRQLMQCDPSAPPPAGAHIRLDALKDKLYEIINTGHWSSVPQAIRKSYTLATFTSVLHSVAAAAGGQIDRKLAQNITYHLDHGLLLGCPLRAPHANLLSDAIQHISDARRSQAVASERSAFAPLHSDEAQVRSADERAHCDVPVLCRPTLEHFEREHFRALRPAILTDCMDQWPALAKWCDPQYLLDAAGDRTVPVEVGASYTQSDWSQDLVRFGDFLRKHLCSAEATTEIVPRPVEYLAQHNLFDQIPALRADLMVPEYCCLTATPSVEEPVDIKAWLGPAGTVSPAHTDPKHNLLCQVFGHKQVLLAAPEETANLYPHATAMLNNTSRVDAEQVDTARYPLAANVRWYRMRLYRGEMLYIPPGWWHHVRALERSFSVSFWWD